MSQKKIKHLYLWKVFERLGIEWKEHGRGKFMKLAIGLFVFIFVVGFLLGYVIAIDACVNIAVKILNKLGQGEILVKKIVDYALAHGFTA